MKILKMFHHITRIDNFNFSRSRLFKNLLNLEHYPIIQFSKCLYSKEPSNCWKCGANLSQNPGPFCGRCETLQKPIQKDNYFRLLGIEENFDIEETSLKDNYRKLQSFIHPDKFKNKTYEEQTISEEYSSLANKAFRSLQLPLKRAEHLLALKGLVLKEEPVDDHEFLVEIMILNEEIEEANDDEVKLKVLDKKNKKMLQKLLEELSYSFKNNDMENVKKIIVKLKYFYSISNRLSSIFREMGVTD